MVVSYTLRFCKTASGICDAISYVISSLSYTLYNAGSKYMHRWKLILAFQMCKDI